jgi:hypothetical protein
VQHNFNGTILFSLEAYFFRISPLPSSQVLEKDKKKKRSGQDYRFIDKDNQYITLPPCFGGC